MAVQGLDQATKVIAILLQSALREAAPKGTGKFRKSIKVIAQSGGILSVEMEEIWKYLEFGTNPHVIQPANKKALAFENEQGQLIITKKVNHPGTRPQPFIRATLDTKLPNIIRSVLNG